MSSTMDQQELREDLSEFVRVYLDDRTGEETPPIGKVIKGEADAVRVDWRDLFQFDQELADAVVGESRQYDRETVMGALEDAVRDYDIADFQASDVPVEITALPEDREREIGRFNADEVGELVSVTGQVTRKTVVKPKIEEAAFECQRCGIITTVPQTGGDFQEPHECRGCERQGPFRIRHDQSEFSNYQKMRIQIPPERARGSNGESIDVSLEGKHLMDRADVGDRVSVAAELGIQQEQSGNQRKATFDWVGQGESVACEETDLSDIEVTSEDIQRIREIAASDDTFDQIVNSIKPSHHGDEEIKLAIALQLFGGVKKQLSDGSTKRGDSHILLIGDPGTGKTDLIKYASELVPRSIYTSGKSASGVGLTAAAVRDDFADGEWTIQGGAMVRAHKGLAAIDELDKMDDNDRGSLFEALSEQKISVSKAGINATLPAQTKLLAAANPVLGRFDPYQPIADQIDLGPALISRFDLIFIVTDKPDEETDRELAEHITGTHKTAAMRERGDDLPEDAVDDPEISKELMRKYVAHASDLTPVLTDEAEERIRDEYVNVRISNQSEDDDDNNNDPIPTTPRAIEAMIRLAEASARIRLSERVSIEDAERAISLWKSCLKDIGVDPDTGQFDADMIETGTSSSQRDRIKQIYTLIADLEEETARGAPHDDVIESARDMNISSERAGDAIEKLKQQGQVMEVATDYYRTT